MDLSSTEPATRMEDQLVDTPTNALGVQQWISVPVAKVPAMGRHRLPQFSLGGYITTITAQSRPEKERMEEKQRAEERRRKEFRGERERRTAMFTTPGLPPLAMAPDIDPKYLESILPSDKQYGRLFPNNPEMICEVKDIFGELQALDEYYLWLWEKIRENQDSEERIEFYTDLKKEIRQDHDQVLEEYAQLMNRATPLALFEYSELDRDLKTTGLEQKLKDGDIFIWNEQEPSIQATYGHLFSKYPYLQRFEMYYHLDKGTRRLEKDIVQSYISPFGQSSFRPNDEVIRKYKYVKGRIEEKREHRYKKKEAEAQYDALPEFWEGILSTATI